MATLTHIPLAQLRLSPTNARQTPGDVTSLANSIRAVGLITPLAVTAVTLPDNVAYRHPDFANLVWSGRGQKPAWVNEWPAGQELPKATPLFLVEAGGRRLAALQRLRDQGVLPLEFPVPCCVFDSPALARSLAENMERAPMDLVQQFQAFARLIGEGQDVHQVAEQFSVTPQFVRQRVRLAQLVPEVIDAYRQSRCTLQQMEALTFGTPEQQRAIVMDPRIPGAWELRARLRGSVVPQYDRRVKFVGMQAYLDAGGRVAEDLFASTADLLDVDILDQLVAEKLQAAADAEMAAGAAFTAVIPPGFSKPADLTAALKDYKPTPAQQAELDALERKAAELEEAIQEANGEDEQLGAELEQVQEQIDTLTDQCEHYPEGIPIGRVLSIGYDGVVIVEAVVRKADVVQARKQQEPEKDDTSAPERPAGPTAARAELTVKCAQEIAQYRGAMAALAVEADTQLALALLAQAWDSAIFGPLQGLEHGTMPRWFRSEAWLGTVERCPPDLRPEAVQEEINARTLAAAQSRRRLFADACQRDENTMRESIPLSWYINQPKIALLQILAHCMAHAIADPDARDTNSLYNLPTGARNTIANILSHAADRADCDMSKWWKPSAAWLKSYGREKTLCAVEQAAPDAWEAIGGLKPAQLYTAAADALSKANWVPAFATPEGMRGEQ